MKDTLGGQSYFFQSMSRRPDEGPDRPSSEALNVQVVAPRSASISRFQTALPTMARAKIRILGFKNPPPFRHYPDPDLKIHV